MRSFGDVLCWVEGHWCMLALLWVGCALVLVLAWRSPSWFTFYGEAW